MEALFAKPIPTDLCLVIPVYGLIQSIAGRNRVQALYKLFVLYPMSIATKKKKENKDFQNQF